MNEKQIRVLLIDDNSGDALLVRRMLAEAGAAAFPLECADRLATGLERLTKGGIDVVLLDLSLPDSHGPETFERIRAAVPGVAIVLLSALDDEALAFRLVQAGAQDYLVKNNINSPSLGRVLRYAAERHRKTVAPISGESRRAPGKVFAFIGAKGGVGTTTTVVNIAAFLAKKGARVIALELRDSFGTFAQQLHHLPQSNVSHLLGFELEQITEAEIESHLVNLSFGLKALFGPQAVSEFTAAEPEKAEAVIRGLARLADFVLIDLPGTAFGASSVAARLSDCVGLVVDREPLSFVCALKVLETLRMWGIADALMATVIVNRSALPNAQSISEINAKLGCNSLGVVTPAVEVCARANGAGSPFVLSDPESTIAGAVTEIANRLMAGHLVPVKA